MFGRFWLEILPVQKSSEKITPLQKDPKQQELGIGEGFC